MSVRPLVIGLGNPERGDDGVGRRVAQGLRDLVGDGADIVEARGEASEIAMLLEGRDTAFLVDACVSGAPAGTIRRLDMACDPPPRAASALSSHGLGLAEAIALARALGGLPPLCVIYAIECGTFAPGAPLSPGVAAAAVAAARLIAEEIGAARR